MDRVASPVFAGRASELSQLGDAFEACLAGSARIALICADAGGGKTRLLREFADRVKARATIVGGGCTDQSESGLPYAPFTAAIRGLVRERGLGEVVALIGTSSAGDLAWLLPEFGAPRALPDAGIVRSRLFEVVRLLMERLAQQRPLVWIAEDLHWADAQTRDLLRHLAANLAAVPVLLLASHRTDALHRDHPLRTTLAELGRAASTRTLRLPALTRPEVAAQLRGILGREPEAATVSTVHARSEGIPLFAEALVAADGTPRAQVPESIDDLLLCAVRELPTATQAALCAASLGGSAIRDELVAAVLAMPVQTLEEQLRPALAANVLVAQGGRCAFRHQLIREAVVGDMLVGERRRLHAAYAAVLAARPALAGETWAALALARHWQLAGEDERAFVAAWQGAREARAASAYAEQLEMLELMLDVWPRVPEAHAAIGASHLDVVEQAANAACWAGRPERGMLLTEIGLAQAREAGDRERVAALLGMQRAPMRQHQLQPGQIEDLEAALRLSTHDPRLRIECLAQLCRALLVRERIDAVEPRARELAEIAERSGDEAGRIEARITRAMLDTRRGIDTRAELEAVVARCARASSGAPGVPGRGAEVADMASPSGWLEVLAMSAGVEAEAAMGRHARAAERAERAARRCLEVGQAGYIGATLAQHRARALQFVGRWDEAIAVLEQALDAEPAPFGRAQLLLVRAEIAVLRGDVVTARQGLAHLRSFAPELLARPLSIERLALDLLLLEGDLAAATRLAGELPERCRQASAQEAWPLLALALRVLVDADKNAAAVNACAAAAGQLPQPGPVERAYARLASAEHARFGARAASGPWLDLAEAWAALGQRHERAYALMRAAAGEPSRSLAAERLAEAEGLASALDAQPLLQRIRVVAQRRRMAPDTADPSAREPRPFALTTRELDVLKLLAEGHTNRQIASALVISAKTASVHVTHIFSKLDVRTRGAAAALAHRLGLTER